MNTKEKFDDIKVSMLPKETQEKLGKLKTATKDFTIKDERVDKFIDQVHAKLKKEKPKALRSLDKPEPKKEEKPKPQPKPKEEPKKEEPKPTPREKKKGKAEIDKLEFELKNDPLLKGFGNSDKNRDAGRRALPKGRRVSKKGWKNQHGESKGGRVYYENRENRSDRRSPDYKKGYPYLSLGGYTHPIDADGEFYVKTYTEADGMIINVKEKTYRDKDSALTYAMMSGNFLRKGQSIFVMDDEGNVIYKKVSMKAKGGYMEHGGESERNYADWEMEVTESLSDKLGIDYGDASAIVEAQPFYMQQSWTKGLSPQETAKVIDEKSSMEHGGEFVDFEQGLIIAKFDSAKDRMKFEKELINIAPDSDFEITKLDKNTSQIMYDSYNEELVESVLKSYTDDYYEKGGYVVEGEDYEYVNTFGVDQDDFEEIVDYVHDKHADHEKMSKGGYVVKEKIDKKNKVVIYFTDGFDMLTKEDLNKYKKQLGGNYTLKTNAGVELHSGEMDGDKWKGITIEKVPYAKLEAMVSDKYAKGGYVVKEKIDKKNKVVIYFTDGFDMLTKEDLNKYKKQLGGDYTLKTNAGVEVHSGEMDGDKWKGITIEKVPYAKLEAMVSDRYAKGGKIGFEALAEKVAKRYEGKPVKGKYQMEYGKTYDKEEAKEVGEKVAGKVYREQLAKKNKKADGGELEMGIKQEMKEHGMSKKEATKTAKDHLKEDDYYYTKLKEAGLEKGGEVEGKKLPHRLTKYFTKPKGTIEVEMSKITPIRARKEGIINAEKYMRLAYEGKQDKRKPITIYKTRNGRYKIHDGNSTYAVAKKNGWKTILAEVIVNPNYKGRSEVSTFSIAKKIRKEGESWQDAVQRAKTMRNK